MSKIIFIQPRYTEKQLDRNIKTIYPLGLAYLAAYVPTNWDVNIIDEQIEKINFNIKADIVGITTTTLTANRAYKIASEFKKRNVTVIIGGVHASMCPDEAVHYCDSACIGDGEHEIVKIIKDYENNCLKKIYKSKIMSLDNLKIPRHDLFKKKYSVIPVSSSRGCPFNCNFCAINKFYNGKYRTRNVEEVIKELKQLPAGYKIVFFTDGNIFGYTEHDAKRFKLLCKRIYDERLKKNLKFKQFMCYVSLNALFDDETLELASKAGCIAMFIGFESINYNSLKDMNKNINLKYGVESYKKAVDNVRKKNILVVGEIVVGSDSDNEDILNKTKKFLKNIDFDILRLQILQPFPGTSLFESLKKQKRLYLKEFPKDWQKLTEHFMTGIHYKLKNIDEKKLYIWVKKTGLEFYSIKNIILRAWKNFKYSKNIKLAIIIIIMNLKSRKSYANMRI